MVYSTGRPSSCVESTCLSTAMCVSAFRFKFTSTTHLAVYIQPNGGIAIASWAFRIIAEILVEYTVVQGRGVAFLLAVRARGANVAILRIVFQSVSQIIISVSLHHVLRQRDF